VCYICLPHISGVKVFQSKALFTARHLAWWPRRLYRNRDSHITPMPRPVWLLWWYLTDTRPQPIGLSLY